MRIDFPIQSASKLAAALALGITATASNASLIGGAAENFQGTGLGSVNTVLTITSSANSTFEQGSVGRNASNALVVTGDTAATNQTLTFAAIGATSAANLRVVFNALEPNNAANQGITLSNLVLNLYSPTGSLLFSSGAFTPVTFADTFSGAGNSGFVFRLDTTQAAAAQAAAFGSGFASNQIGLTASAGCTATQTATCQGATGGFETFFVANAPGVVSAVPEPETYALLMAGLGVVGFIARRRKT